MSHPATYAKLVIQKLTGDFRSSTGVATATWQEPGRGQVVIRNRYAGCNAIFDKNLCRNSVRYVDVKPPFAHPFTLIVPLSVIQTRFT